MEKRFDEDAKWCFVDAVPMIQQLESTLRAGAVPQAPQFRPSAVNSAKSKDDDDDNKPLADKGESEKKSVSLSAVAAADPLGDARSKVQEEISREFAAIMASGTLRASEAAALATRRVMQRHGYMSNTAQS